MPKITNLSLIGDWRVIVQSRSAAWQSRVWVSGTASGTQILAGNVGLTMDVYGNEQTPWEFHIQHNDGTHSWQDSWLRPGSRQINGSIIKQVVESEDDTSPASDLDFNDLIICLEKIGMIDQPTKPFAVWPNTLQMMPGGIFEASLGQYFMGVRVRNVWTEILPDNSLVRISDRCRQWLAASGITVIDSWSQDDQAAVGQEVIGGNVLVGPLDTWETDVIYFKVDVSNALPRKHMIEVQVNGPVTESLSHINRYASAPIFVSRTNYDAQKKVFVSNCDHGNVTVAIKEIAVDFNTFKKAMGRAIEIFKNSEKGASTYRAPGSSDISDCGRYELEMLRIRLLAFLEGKDSDICGIWRDIQCCCARGGFGNGGGGEDPEKTWTGRGGTGMEFFVFPTILDYRIDYSPGFIGQYGPIPYDDPWWKLLLIIIAVLLSLGSAASATADLVNKSEDVVIGEVARSSGLKEKDNIVDAAVVALNGNRYLTQSIFSYLDAASGEQNIKPVVSLGGIIDTPGTTMSNEEIRTLLDTFKKNPNDPDAQRGVRVFKSGARTGLTFGRMDDVHNTPRQDDDMERYFLNQLFIVEDEAMPNWLNDKGDSGSLWIHLESKAIVALHHGGGINENYAVATRIEDVKNFMNIHFADEGEIHG